MHVKWMREMASRAIHSYLVAYEVPGNALAIATLERIFVASYGYITEKIKMME